MPSTEYAKIIAAQPYAKRAWFKEDRWANRVHELSDVQVEFIEWLLDPAKDKGTQKEWAAAHSVPLDSGWRWKKTRFFREAWEKRAAELNGGPDRVQNVINAMYEKALEGDVPAAKAYLAHVGKTTPIMAAEVKEVAKLSDDELAEHISNLRSVKGTGTDG